MTNGKVLAEGRNKGKHFVDTESEHFERKGVEIPFYQKKDRIV